MVSYSHYVEYVCPVTRMAGRTLCVGENTAVAVAEQFRQCGFWYVKIKASRRRLPTRNLTNVLNGSV